MSDSSAIPVRRGDDARQAKTPTKVEAAEPTAVPSLSPAGPRKLVRPRLPEGAPPIRHMPRVAPISSMHAGTGRWSGSATTGETSHAEAFYFQKQIQGQTLMMFVLEDGTQIEGTIEWYDRHCIKVKNSGRMLIYKSSIKYLYKAAEQHTV